MLNNCSAENDGINQWFSRKDQWEALPGEVLLNCFQYLLVEDLFWCSQVCRAWYGASNDQQLWKMHCITQLDTMDFNVRNLRDHAVNFSWKKAYFLFIKSLFIPFRQIQLKRSDGNERQPRGTKRHFSAIAYGYMEYDQNISYKSPKKSSNEIFSFTSYEIVETVRKGNLEFYREKDRVHVFNFDSGKLTTLDLNTYSNFRDYCTTYSTAMIISDDKLFVAVSQIGRNDDFHVERLLMTQILVFNLNYISLMAGTFWGYDNYPTCQTTTLLTNSPCVMKLIGSYLFAASSTIPSSNNFDISIYDLNDPQKNIILLKNALDLTENSINFEVCTSLLAHLELALSYKKKSDSFCLVS